jgi:fimbrial chaperone protein
MTSRIARHLAAAAFVLTAALSSVPASAGSVVLWPINPKIMANERATALWLENRGDAPVTLQVRALGWSQDQGMDQYAAQDEVVASPPIATVAPGKRQLVRLVRRSPAPSSQEHSYRLLIDELPPVAEPGKAAESAPQLNVRMRYSIPLFTGEDDVAQAAARLDLRFTAAQGKRFVEIRNRGDRHARLVDLRLVHGSRQLAIRPGLVGYVLPGAVMRWALPADAPLVGTILVNVNGADQSLSPNT